MFFHSTCRQVASFFKEGGGGVVAEFYKKILQSTIFLDKQAKKKRERK